MNLDEYTNKHSPSFVIDAFNKAKPDDRKEINHAILYQWRKGIRSISPADCVTMEEATNYEVSKKEMRSDWARIWKDDEA